MKLQTFFMTVLCGCSLLCFGSSDGETEQQAPTIGTFIQTNLQLLEAKLNADLSKAEQKLEKYNSLLEETTDESELNYLEKKIQSQQNKIGNLRTTQSTIDLWKLKLAGE